MKFELIKMRSTKDLKDIVTDIRGKSKGRLPGKGEMPSLNQTFGTNKENTDDEGSFIAKAKNGGVTYGARKHTVDSSNGGKSSNDVGYYTTP